VLPHFDLQGGFALCAVRAGSVGCLLSVFGALVFRALVAPRAFARMEGGECAAVKRRLLVLAQASAAAGLMLNALWLIVQAANMADANTVIQLVAAVPEVAMHTAFGRVLLAQSASLLALLATLGVRDREWRQRGGLCLATLTLCLQAGHSHAYSMYDGPSVLLAFDALHLLGAGAWLGGLVPLLLLVRGAPPRAGAQAARWFSPLGQWCIAALVLSAAFQSWVLIATVPGLVGTAYGWMAAAKLALFGVLLGFAAVNRYRLAPALLAGDAEAAKRTLVFSIALQTGAAIAIVVAAAVLSELPPAMHEQPLWPFGQRFSLAAINEDPDFLREVLCAGAALVAAAAVAVTAFIARRWRVAAVVIAAVIAWFALPHLDLLLVAAYPTSFYHSPSGFASASIVQGRDIYAQHCVACHGADGRGDTANAARLAAPPADLTAAHLWMHADGELFWWLSHGIFTPEGAQAMPGFAAILDDDQRWALIDFIRARNAGTAMQASGTWPHIVAAPGFGAACGATNISSADLRGSFVLLRFEATPHSAAPRGVVTVETDAPAVGCTTEDETVARAYAIVSGTDVAHLPGTAFLIDDAGRLRAMQRAGTTPGWSDPAALAGEISALRAEKAPSREDAPMKMPM
jgi:putative copper export protein/mono/diheme cytochrome c family protein